MRMYYNIYNIFAMYALLDTSYLHTPRHHLELINTDNK